MRRSIRIAAVLMSVILLLPCVVSTKTVVRADADAGNVRLFVERLYREALGRVADEQGEAEWVDLLVRGERTGANVAFGFIFSDDCRELTADNAAFVQVLYRAMLGRQADEAGLSSWVSFLEAGHKRSMAFAGFVNSPEFSSICASYGIVRGEYRYIDPSRPMIALTFDDGPSGRTAEIVACLEANRAAATFFVTGLNAQYYPNTLARIASSGSEIGNHTYDHSGLTRLSDDDIRGELSSVDDMVMAATGSIVPVVRPPYGSHDARTDAIIARPIMLWNVDTLDWRTRNAQSTINHVLSNARDGDIILMHDIYSPTVDAALYLIPELQRRGFQLVTVSELAEYRGGAQAGNTYYSFRP